MEVETSLIGDVVVLKLIGELTSRNPLSSVFWSHLHRGQSKFVVNLERVRAINSVGLNSLLDFKRLSEAAGGGIILCSVCDEVKGILKSTGIEEVFAVFDDEEPALAGFIKGLPSMSSHSSVSRYRN